MKEPIYLDYAASTPVDPRVAVAIGQCLQRGGIFGNPSSSHAYGRAARDRVEEAREQAGALIGASPATLVWTSGATEANNLAVLGTARAAQRRGRHLVSARTEHKSVLDACRRLEHEGFRVSYLQPDAGGRIDPGALAMSLRPDTVLVSLMHANNETGVLQDLEAIGQLCRARGVPLHVDAAQSAGKVPVDVERLGADLLSVSAHKLYGPKGVGVLYVHPRRRGSLQPLLYGGGQERGLRSGTLAVHQIAGFGVACEIARRELPREVARLTALRERLWGQLSALDGVLRNGDPRHSVPGILSVSFSGVQGEALLAGLPELALAAGSACDSESDEPSYVLRALGREPELARSSLRFSLGRYTRAGEIDQVAAAVIREVRRLRAAARGAPVPALPVRATRVSGRDSLGRHARTRFRALLHAGPAVRARGSARGARAGRASALPAPERWVSGEAGRESEGTRVIFSLAVAAGRITQARYSAYGCPHTLAACEWLAARLERRKLAGLSVGQPAGWARALSIPAEKLGRLLIVEDALQAALAAADTPRGVS